MTDTGPPKHYFKVKDEFPEFVTKYEELSEVAHKAGPLNAKMRAIAKLGIAVGMGHRTSVRSQVRKCLEAGLTFEEIRHAVLLSGTQMGFARMIAALSWADSLRD